MLHLLEGEVLSRVQSVSLPPISSLAEPSYLELVDNVGSSLDRRVLIGEHRLVAVERGELVSVVVERLVVEVDELLYKGSQ